MQLSFSPVKRLTFAFFSSLALSDANTLWTLPFLLWKGRTMEVIQKQFFGMWSLQYWIVIQPIELLVDTKTRNEPTPAIAPLSSNRTATSHHGHNLHFRSLNHFRLITPHDLEETTQSDRQPRNKDGPEKPLSAHIFESQFPSKSRTWASFWGIKLVSM